MSRNDQMSAADQWLIKNESDQVKGPFSTEAIRKMILEGIFTGQESIAKYPNGDWKSIAKQTEFYETLLESLENPVELDEKKEQKMEAETVVRIRPSLKIEAPPLADLEKSEVAIDQFEVELKKLLANSAPTEPPRTPIKKPIPSKNLVPDHAQLLAAQIQADQIHLKNMKKRQLRKMIPLGIGLLVVTYLMYSIFWASTADRQKMGWALIIPEMNEPEISAGDLKKLKLTAIGLIKTGTFENVLKAQGLVVQAIEGQKRDMESIGLLCATHGLLWPYVKQQSNDLKASAFMAQYARATSAISSYADACQAVNLVAKGQINDARAVFERILDQNTEKSFLLYPFIYLMHAEVLEENSNLLNAEAFYRESVKSFPGWNWGEFNLGRVTYKQSKHVEALQIFESILVRKPNYKAALYGKALIASKFKQDRKLAFDFFEQGYKINEILPKVFHLEALQEYIDLLMENKNEKRALEVAQFGLRLNPAHRALKDIFISLGGETRFLADAQAAQGITLGDQYFRHGDFFTAQGQYKAAFDSDGKNALLAVKIAKSLWVLNQTREAYAWLDKAIAIDPKFFSAYALKAEYLSQKFNFLDAQTVLTKAQQMDPNNYDILKTVTKIEFKKNNLATALANGERAYRQYSVDVELLTLLANINVGLYLQPVTNTGEAETQKLAALEGARKYATKAIDLEPSWPESQISYVKFVGIKEGENLAEYQFKDLIKAFPYTADYRIALAEFYESQEKYNFAQEIYQTLVTADPKNKKANLGLARCYRMKLDEKMAIRYYIAAALLDTSDVEPLFSVGQLELEMGIAKGSTPAGDKEKAKALVRFDSVKKINPNYPKVYYFTAKAFYEMRDYEKALEFLAIEKQKNPGLSDPYALTAEIFHRQGKFSDCAEEYQITLKYRPQAENYIGAAICYRKAEMLDLAEEMLNYTVEMKDGRPRLREGSDVSAFREYGYIYENRGNKEEARRYYTIYLDLTAHNAFDAKDIKRRLDGL